MIYISEIFWRHSWDVVHLFQIILNFMYVCWAVCMLTSLSKLDKGISPVLDETSFFNLFESFLGCSYTSSKYFKNSCIYVSPLVGLLPYWNYKNLGISLVLDKIFFWIFLETFPGYFWTISKLCWIFCMSVSPLVGLLPYWNKATIGISPVLDDISFWIFWRYSWDGFTLFPNNHKFCVWLSVPYLAYFLTEVRPI